jgi:hypothetical protein
MKRRHFMQGAAAMLAAPAALDAFQGQAQEQKWMAAAEALKPQLRRTPVTPVSLVRMVADPGTFLRWRVEPTAPAAEVSRQLMRGGDAVTLDFGRHLVGYLTFTITGEGRGIDAPTRLKLTFGEVPAEVAEPFDPYTGTLSRAWLQDEVINIDVLPATIEMPRRYAFRFLKIEAVATSPNFAVRLSGIRAGAVTSAGNDLAELPPGTPELLRRIDRVSVATLRDCMQTVFEDGPKRDRRLWIGDMRLQALTNYATFRNFDLVKRCLYLFAAFPREDGLVAACEFEEPQPHRGHEYIIDYAALYAAAVVDYAEASNDWATAVELWPVVRRQMEILSGYVGKDGIFAAPANAWVFIDWSQNLDKTAAMHGVFLYSLRYAQQLAEKAGAHEEAAQYGKLMAALTSAARANFRDEKQRVFVSGPKRQVSFASQAWMTLAGVASDDEAMAALRTVASMQDAVKPGAPYLYHYMVDAMMRVGMKQDARALIERYWGGMVRAGADTFWEVYDPENPQLSPYGNTLVVSYCHAWSCTPAYFLRSGKLL